MKSMIVNSSDSGQSSSLLFAQLYHVTDREKEVLQKMSEGLTVKEIAACLFVSCHTIISHKKNLIEKFDAKNSIELIVKAIKQGLISF